MTRPRYLTAREVCEQTGLRRYQLDYLKDNEIIPSIRRGSGYPVLYPMKVVQIIKNRLKSKDIHSPLSGGKDRGR